MRDPMVYEWPTLAGRRWLLTCYCLVIMLPHGVTYKRPKSRLNLARRPREALKYASATDV